MLGGDVGKEEETEGQEAEATPGDRQEGEIMALGGPEQGKEGLDLGNEYLRTPDGCFWLRIGGVYKAMVSMDEVYHRGILPVRDVEELP